MPRAETPPGTAMPLRDHFHFPANKRARWESVFAGWPGVITTRMNAILPDEYAAGPLLRGGYGADTVFDLDPWEPEPDAVVGGWSPGRANFTAEAGWTRAGRFEVEVHDRQREELVVTIQLVAPSNKESDAHRRYFVNKCAGLMQAGVSVVVVDVVTDRGANLYSELLDAVGQSDPAVTDPPQGIYAAACRSRPAQQGEALETWYYPLAVGGPLPTLPVWLSDRLAVPLELEPIYEETLRALRIR